MNTHTIPYTKSPDWSSIPVITLANMQWRVVEGIAARAQICYTDDAIWLKLAARESPIVHKHTGPLGAPYEDSCLEFFFCPAENDNRYFNFEFNPNACLLLGIGTGRNDRTRLIVEDQQAMFSPIPQITDDSWSITYKIPFAFIQRFFPAFSPCSGLQFRANFFKCGHCTPHPHYLTWNLCNSHTPSFHSPNDFGLLIFG